MHTLSWSDCDLGPSTQHAQHRFQGNVKSLRRATKLCCQLPCESIHMMSAFGLQVCTDFRDYSLFFLMVERLINNSKQSQWEQLSRKMEPLEGRRSTPDDKYANNSEKRFPRCTRCCIIVSERSNHRRAQINGCGNNVMVRVNRQLTFRQHGCKLLQARACHFA
jgi:hypothetical protein